MKKLFLILAAATFMIACTPKSAPVVEEPIDEQIEVVDDAVVDDATPTTPAKPAKPTTTTPKAEEPQKEEPKVETPKEEPKETPKEEPKTNEVKKRR